MKEKTIITGGHKLQLDALKLIGVSGSDKSSKLQRHIPTWA
jgi:hypothetical protein